MLPIHSTGLYSIVFVIVASIIPSAWCFVGCHTSNVRIHCGSNNFQFGGVCGTAGCEGSKPTSTSLSATTNRRAWLEGIAKGALLSTATAGNGVKLAYGDDDYENPNIPAGPEERSGLVVLRVAEVAQFQEKILRAVASGQIEDVTVTPQQIVFGTQVLLRNSNLGGNMKLMIDNEVPRKMRKEAVGNAVKTMNTLQSISTKAAEIQRPFEKEEMLMIADLYRDVRLQLNQMYEYLPQKEKDKYYGYFMAVTEYEKKIAEGTYNPELDGILKFD